ncbi:hypothetical protein CAPTEDRAFT_196957 [Capitella teleta]|uniref:VWFD domain-containing protein n=1 Tax=Capitella teleta TaxID=283909 RepID=R7TB83_CAPTE|nr:hypothetical protein CAPTEDRAFT_196957 [Capitella teleta]|eukprot:ELT90969.1 hypothetical protein CAPTEDRAFT_196957 [Capitella teleta]
MEQVERDDWATETQGDVTRTTTPTSKAVCGAGKAPVCLTCHGATDEKDCFFKGVWKQCPDDTYTCVRRTYRNKAGQLRISRNCGQLAKCPAFKPGCMPDSEPSKSCSECSFKSPSTYSKCDFMDTSVCQLAGDPHCKQFNALPGEPLLNLNGHCKYNMVTTYCKPGRGHGWFELHASFMSANEGKSAFMQKLSITYHNDLYMLESNVIDLRTFGPVVLPFQKSGMEISKLNGLYFFKVSEGITIAWDGHHKVNVVVPKNIAVCGLCGQHTKDFEGADLRVGRSYVTAGCYNMNVTTEFNGMAKNKQEFIHSWFIGQNGQQACAKECGGP